MPDACGLPAPTTDLSDHNAELHRRVLQSPGECIPPFEEALEEYIRNDEQYRKARGWRHSGPGSGMPLVWLHRCPVFGPTEPSSMFLLSCSFWLRMHACTWPSLGSSGPTPCPRAS